MFKFKKLAVFVALLIITLSLSIPTYAAKSKDSWPKGPELLSDSGIVMDASTGTVLYEKNSNEKLYPASITKLMTVLLTIENTALDEVVTFSHDSVYSIEVGSSNIGIVEGEKLTIEQCLYGILLASANEVSYAVGEHIGGGDITTFIDMMNKRAKELGCKNTHFCNPHGLHDNDHYTTTYDMALITKELLKYDTFRIISGSSYYVIPKTNITKQTRPLSNTHKMIITSPYKYDGVEGGKTGFTDQALNTLVTYAQKDNLELICVTMHGNQAHYIDTTALLNFGFDNFKSVNIANNESRFNKSNLVANVFDDDFLNQNLSLINIDNNTSAVIPKDLSLNDIDASITYTDNNPYLTYTYSNKTVGSAKINISDNTDNYIFTENVETTMTTDKVDDKFPTKIIIFIVVAVIIILILISYLFNIIRRNKRRHRR